MPPLPLLANRTALRTFNTLSVSTGSFRIFLASLSILAISTKEAFFSFSTTASVGSNWEFDINCLSERKKN
jgi:hypothetical protein